MLLNSSCVVPVRLVISVRNTVPETPIEFLALQLGSLCDGSTLAQQEI